MGDFNIPKINMFQQPVQQVSFGARGPQVDGGARQGGVAAGGQTAFEKDMADFRQYLPAFNGTGDLRPVNNAKFDMLA